MSSPTYASGNFEALAETELGKNLWSFLNEAGTLIRLETATALSRPAVEGIEEQLLERFQEQVLDDRVKQMVGHMTRQVMEHHGYAIDQQDVKMTNGAPFSRATRYARRDEFVFHVFHKPGQPRSLLVSLSRSDPEVTGGPWRFWKSVKGELRACIALGLPEIKLALQDMKQTGFYKHEMPRLLKAPGDKRPA